MQSKSLCRQKCWQLNNDTKVFICATGDREQWQQTFCEWSVYFSIAQVWTWIYMACQVSKLHICPPRERTTYFQREAQRWWHHSLSLSTVCYRRWEVMWSSQRKTPACLYLEHIHIACNIVYRTEIHKYRSWGPSLIYSKKLFNAKAQLQAKRGMKNLCISKY